MTARKNNVSEAGRAAMRENVKKAQEASRRHRNIRPDSPALKIIKGQNARKASTVRTARAILKAIPEGVLLGTEFRACQYRKLKVLDPVPVRRGNVWEQRFLQSGQMFIKGGKKVLPSSCRVYWKYRPTAGTILDEPLFEEGNDRENLGI